MPDWLSDVLATAPDTDDEGMATLWNLGAAFLSEGFVIDIPDGVTVEEPLNLIIRASEGFSAPRLVIRLGRNASLTITERHDGQGRFWKNAVTQIVLGANASLRHYRMQEDGVQGVYTQSTHIMLDRDARYEGFTLTTGAALSRNQIHADMNGAGSDCRLNGINLQRGTQQADATMLVEHRAPHCTSNQLLRTVLDNQSRGVYQGKVYVHREAQKTDGYQLANTLLLSEGAEMDTKPELEIYADDVKCSHGATTGRLDEDPLFYMRARGIPEAAARALLIEAFLGEVVEKVSFEPMRPILIDTVRTWLGS
jgi:Fe-S cluster assembly protein SufD